MYMKMIYDNEAPVQVNVHENEEVFLMKTCLFLLQKVLFSVIGVVLVTLLIYIYYDVSPAGVSTRDSELLLESLDGRASHSGTW